MRRGKNTNNTLRELKAVYSDMKSGNFDFDGMHAGNAMDEVKEDISELVVGRVVERVLEIISEETEVLESPKEFDEFVSKLIKELK